MWLSARVTLDSASCPETMIKEDPPLHSLEYPGLVHKLNKHPTLQLSLSQAVSTERAKSPNNVEDTQSLYFVLSRTKVPGQAAAVQ